MNKAWAFDTDMLFTNGLYISKNTTSTGKTKDEALIKLLAFFGYDLCEVLDDLVGMRNDLGSDGFAPVAEDRFMRAISAPMLNCGR